MKCYWLVLFIIVFTAQACSPSTEKKANTSTTEQPSDDTPLTQETEQGNETSSPISPIQIEPVRNAVGLTVFQILLRYDGAQPLGTFEITVCNFGETDADPFSVDLSVNGEKSILDYPQQLLMGACDGIFEETTDFSTFGISEPQLVTVSASITTSQDDLLQGFENLEHEMMISILATQINEFSQKMYDDCRMSGTHNDCFSYLENQPASEPHEIMKQNGIYFAIVPAEYEPWAAWYIATNHNCAISLEKYLGIPVYPIVPQRVMVADLYYGEYYERILGLVISTDPEYYSSIIEYEIDIMFQQANQGICGNAHEMTYLFFGDPPMPYWLHEGIARYMEHPELSNSIEGFTEAVFCTKDSFTTSFSDESTPFAELSVNDPEIPRNTYYNTAACFWDYIEQNYGHEVFQDIVKVLREQEHPDFNYCSERAMSNYFVRDILTPILGEDISPITLERWGFGELYTGCE